MLMLKIWAAVALLLILLNVIRFRYQLGVFFREQFPRPLDWPVWVYRLRRWARREWRSIRNRRAEVAGILFVITVLMLLAFGLIATSPA
ncbi:hypothetical protein [Spirosoma horti]